MIGIMGKPLVYNNLRFSPLESIKLASFNWQYRVKFKHMKRSFLGIITLFFLCIACEVTNTKNTSVLMYIGSSNNDSLSGVQYCYLDTLTGALSQPQLVAPMLNPNFLEIDADNNILFATGDQKSGKETSYIINAYKIKENGAKHSLISTVTVPGIHPCYVSLSNDKYFVFTANYTSGDVTSFINEDGKLSFLNSLKHEGSGPNKDRQEKPHAHSIDVDPYSTNLYAADLGSDKLMVYEMKETGLIKVDSVMCNPGYGPRHFDFSPQGQFLAVLNELDCSITTFEKDSTGIYRKELQTLSLLPDTFNGFAKAADIHFTPNGKFLYASNRGFDCIAVFKVNGKELVFEEFVSDEIKWPRNFAIDPSGQFLLVANRDLNNIVVFRINQDTGFLSKVSVQKVVENPICIKFYN